MTKLLSGDPAPTMLANVETLPPANGTLMTVRSLFWFTMKYVGTVESNSGGAIYIERLRVRHQ